MALALCSIFDTAVGRRLNVLAALCALLFLVSCARTTPPLADLGYTPHYAGGKYCHAMFTRGDVLVSTGLRHQAVIYSSANNAFVVAGYDPHPEFRTQKPGHREFGVSCAWITADSGKVHSPRRPETSTEALVYVVRDPAIAAELKQAVDTAYGDNEPTSTYRPRWFRIELIEKRTDDGLPRAIRTDQLIDITNLDAAAAQLQTLDTQQLLAEAEARERQSLAERRASVQRAVEERRLADERAAAELRARQAAIGSAWKQAISVDLKPGDKVCTRDDNWHGRVETVSGSNIKVALIGRANRKQPGFFFDPSTTGERFTFERVNEERWFDRSDIGKCNF